MKRVHGNNSHKKKSRDHKFLKQPVKEFDCNICLSKLRSKYDLKRHMRDVHEEIKSFMCHICQKTVIQLN